MKRNAKGLAKQKSRKKLWDRISKYLKRKDSFWNTGSPSPKCLYKDDRLRRDDPSDVSSAHQLKEWENE
jgi:hypothetical protein